MLNNLDLSKLEEIEKKRAEQALAGAAAGGLAGGIGGDSGATIVNANMTGGGINRQFKFMGGECWQMEKRKGYVTFHYTLPICACQ